MGSLSPVVSHFPPIVVKSVLISLGLSTELPVVLSKTARAVFTVWTYWVAPTAPFVSGGAPMPPVRSLVLIPSKFNPGAAARFFTTNCCHTGSSVVGAEGAGSGCSGRTGMTLFPPPIGDTGGISRSGGVTAWPASWMMIGLFCKVDAFESCLDIWLKTRLGKVQKNNSVTINLGGRFWLFIRSLLIFVAS